MYRRNSDYTRCILYGTAAMNLPPIDHNRVPLFIETNIYEWILEEEFAFCLFKAYHFQRALVHFENIKRLHFHNMDHASQMRVDQEIKACKINL